MTLHHDHPAMIHPITRGPAVPPPANRNEPQPPLFILDFDPLPDLDLNAPLPPDPTYTESWSFVGLALVGMFTILLGILFLRWVFDDAPFPLF